MESDDSMESEMRASWLPCRKPISFLGGSEFGIQLYVCVELQGSHPRGSFFSSLGEKLLGQTFPKFPLA